MRSSKYSKLIGKTFSCQRVENKSKNNSGALYHSEISRGLVVWGTWRSLFSGEALVAESGFFYNQERHNVHGLLGILKVTYSSYSSSGVLFQLIYQVTPRAARLEQGPEQKKVLQQVQAAAQAALTLRPFDPQIQWCLKCPRQTGLLFGAFGRWITAQALRTLEQSPTALQPFWDIPEGQPCTGNNSLLGNRSWPVTGP